MLGDQIWRQQSESGSGYENGEVSGLDDGVLVASNTEDLAKAPHGLFKVSRGDVETIVITEGSECAFLAGLAHWPFNLRIQVQNSQGQSIFKIDEKPAEVIFQYGESRTQAIQIAHTTYVLKHSSAIFGQIRESEEFNIIVRTPWNGRLSRVFGTTFQQLCRVSNLLGDYLGGVARIYKAVSCGEPNTGRICRKNFYYVETSYGHGFIDTVLSTFPGLQRTDGLRDRMQHVMDLKYGPEEGVITSFTPSRNRIVGLAYTIRKITNAMAYTVQAPDGPQLLPAVQGILKLCRDGKSPEPIDDGLEHGELENPLVEAEGRKSDWNTSSFYWNALGLRHEQRRSAVFHYHTLFQ